MDQEKESRHQERPSFEIELGESRSLQSSGSHNTILLSQRVEEEIRDYAVSDTSRELGGVLLGSLKEGKEGTEVHITAMLKAKKTAADKTSLTFTHDTWEQIHLEKEILYPDLHMVGWFHTHPGFGIFLSKHDLFIQHNFFNLPWQTAYVIDPINHEQGFFSWDQQQIKPVHHTMADDQGNPLPGEKNDIPLTETDSKNKKKELPSNGSTKTSQPGMRYIAIALLLLLFASNLHRLTPALQDTDENMERATMLEDQIQMLNEELTHRDNSIVTLQEENQRLSRLVDQLSGEYFNVYTVSPGDTLWSISTRFYNDPEEYRLLMRLNNLEDPNSLEVGQRLLLYKQGD